MSLRDLCTQYGIRLKKRLGQNLLLDDNINRIMVEAAALSPQDDVIEVGAGLGALTARLSQVAGRVLAVEIDPAFMPCLDDQFGHLKHVRLFRGDILNHRLEKLIAEYLPGATQYKMVSNLPYYITTPILFHFWEAPVRFSRMVIMVQEEVGLRLAAKPRSPDYGVLSLAAQYYAEVEIVHHVPRTCFAPRPNVDSCIVRLRARPEPLYPEVDARFLLRVVRTAFAQRRKTLRNALTRSGQLGVRTEVVLAAMNVVDVDPGRRAETLSLDEFARLAREIRGRVRKGT